MGTPNWLAATSGQRPQAGQINQFLGAHSTTYITAGTVQNQQATAGSGGVNSNGLYIAQSFTPSASYGTSRVVITLTGTGSPTPATVTIQSTAGGAPSGTVLGSVQVPVDYVGGPVSVPILASLTGSSEYWIVVNAVGDASDYFTWDKSNQTSGASTSANGSSWTAQAYGLLYQVYAGMSGNLIHTYEDAGARWTTLGFNANGTFANYREYTVAQGSGQYLYSNRSLNYSSGALASVS